MITNNMPVDIHTHILPMIDDGSRSISMSLEMLQEEVRQGIGTVALTPHFYAERMLPGRFLQQREKAFSELLEAAGRDSTVHNYPDLLLGAEVHYFEGMSVSEELRSLCIEGTNLILIEMPFMPWTRHMLDEIDNIHNRLDIVPVVAHIDRYIHIQKKNDTFDRLSGSEVLIQMNAESLIDKKQFKNAMKMLKGGGIHFLGSDCHNMQDRPPVMEEAIKKLESKIGDKETAWLASRSEAFILNARRFKCHNHAMLSV